MILIYFVSLSIIVYLLFSPNGIVRFIRGYRNGKYEIPDKYKKYIVQFSVGAIALIVIIGLITIIVPYITLPLIIGLSFFIRVLKKIQYEKDNDNQNVSNNK